MQVMVLAIQVLNLLIRMSDGTPCVAWNENWIKKFVWYYELIPVYVGCKCMVNGYMAGNTLC